ncbi:MAG: winged helix DNA-binding protein [Dehalococcoidia bacterium]|nr:winged helix DNA-binding protein [Dehalococcoidia bacterium]
MTKVATIRRTTPDAELSEQVRIINKVVHKIWFDVMRPNWLSDKLRNLTFVDLHIISTAHENPDLILRDIKSYLHIPHSTLSSSVSKLERMGLVRRVINRRDLRSYSIELTDEGKKIMEEHERVDADQVSRLIAPLSRDERRQLISLVEQAISRY